MNLSDRDKQIIKDHIDRGDPLPPRYKPLLFADAPEVELVWAGKTDRVENTVLPFQSIEQIDEPREEAGQEPGTLFDADAAGRQSGGWTNKLIWGDNKPILSSLKNGPLREEIKAAGGLKLIYIDPPFDVGADFSFDVEVGGETLTKEPSIIEELAYRDTWGRGTDSYLAMMYERLKVMHGLLADDGSIYVHCDYRVTAILRCVLDAIVGGDSHVNECVWLYKTGGMPQKYGFGRKHDTIHFFAKNPEQAIWNPQTEKSYLSHRYGFSNIELYEDEKGVYSLVNCRDVWDIPALRGNQPERVDFPTQKPEELLERIINASSNEGDLIADFFCGSGTTLAVAEKLGRKWIGCDLGRFATHTSRKRLIGVQRQLKQEGRPYRSFEILNLGRYERQYFLDKMMSQNGRLTAEQKEKVAAEREEQYLNLILQAYSAQRAQQMPPFHGRRGTVAVMVGPIDAPVTERVVNEAVDAALEQGIDRVDALGFDFEMGLVPHAQDAAKGRGVNLALKYIPQDVFDKRAVEKGQVKFYDVAYVEAEPVVEGDRKVRVKLTDFGVFYRQDDVDPLNQESGGRAKKSAVIIDEGRVVKVTKGKRKDDPVQREVLTKQWTDWIDYWSVDFDYESRKEIIRRPKEGAAEPPGEDEYVQVWSGRYIFENEWQSFRTRRDRTLELTSAPHTYDEPGTYRIAVKVIDIFGNDTTRVVEVEV